MTHALQLQPRKSFTFIPIRSWIHTLWRKKLTAPFVFAFSIFLFPNFLSPTSIVQAEPVLLSISHNINDKIVKYMLNVNHHMDMDMAYRLSTAILVENGKHHIPIDLQLGLIASESRFDQFAISNAGALGFYQIMPTVHSDTLKTMYEEGDIKTKNLYDPETQAALGNKILHDCLKIHHQNVPMALQCYNGSVNDKTQTYSRDVLKRAQDAKELLATI